MSVTFSQFCAAGPELREALRRRVDSLGALGQGYEFPNCQMPQGCVPRQSVLGFLKRDRGSPPSLPGASGASTALKP